ncbi:unnamed protein product [Sphenostylis stenocarpa]|uniref:VQ domain-containing protein n=1 Tax=Sphenostylis stenocarpa TaxID=92480 RepID=A0AA86S9E1_9FABA|nr:unnamed protein product [Sphenostylis stenocarpa]
MSIFEHIKSKQLQFFDISGELLSPDMRTATTKFEAINGPRPSSLTINKYSHLIRKPSSSSHVALTKPQSNNPIIIHTKSPKIIHTKPRDFMALVQRLTGMSNSNEHLLDDGPSYQNYGSLNCDGSNKQQESDEEQGEDLRDDESCVKKETFVHSNMDFADLPIFTPNSVYTYPGSPFGFLGTLLSPSGMQFMNELPEY